ncbi:BREX-2 system adenine-specific DNA-methyltransferase PglX [Glycomyces scopariae]
MHSDKLLADLKQQVKLLEADLLERAEEPEFHDPLRAEYEMARSAERIALSYETWLDGQVTQAAAAWVLGTVFLRFCEDNQLIEFPYLASPVEERCEIPLDRQHEFYSKNPGRDTDRDWILEGFADMSAASIVAAGLFDKLHNPMWVITPSHHASQKLVRFWRLRGDNATLAHDFTDSEWNTRFLGDLYQDLSETARRDYALLQTPEMVESLVLDLTLTPAIDEFGLEPEKKAKHVSEDTPNTLRIIDPACGSGHFLLEAFDRLLNAWMNRAPGMESWEIIRKVLAGIHGVDKNPFAVAIARFRLLIAAMKAVKARDLKAAPQFSINIAVGDSLLHGRGALLSQETLPTSLSVHTFATEDIYDQKFRNVDLLGRGSYHVVVGNPPYITVKDQQENFNYREAYKDVCKGNFALTVPFAVRFFELGVHGGHIRKGAAYIGQITANSFMKREFGTELVEMYFNLKVDITHVIDTSGAYIPGHGTPTVILVGRTSIHRGLKIRVVQGIQGEPSQPSRPEEGLVWRAILNQINIPSSESQWVSCEDLNRKRLARHPWNLSGGGSIELFDALSKSRKPLQSVVRLIGRTAHTGRDEAYYATRGDWERAGVGPANIVGLVEGASIRDWQISVNTYALFPYDQSLKPSISDLSLRARLWLHRSHLRTRREPGGTHEEIGLSWYEWSRWHPERFAIALGIGMPFIATHNHFALDRGGRVFKQTAPAIRLPPDASEDDHFKILGLLNSSIACFWLKQVSYPKGGDPVGKEGARVSAESWDDRYEFTGTKLKQFPLPTQFPLARARQLDSLARLINDLQPAAIFSRQLPTQAQLDLASSRISVAHEQMISIQEELDWEVYSHYELFDDLNKGEVTTPVSTTPPGIKFGERAFEIVLARRMATGTVSTEWFSRHHATPITDIPTHWPTAYRELVQRRIACIESHKEIALIERPQYKRRWSTQPWHVRKQAALRNWILEFCEHRQFWFTSDHGGFQQPKLQTVNQLADRFRSNTDFVSVIELYSGSDSDLAEVIADIIDTEHTPFLSSLRYKDSGLRKRRQWETIWELQREEDMTGGRLDIPLPPNYVSADFRKISYWRHRGKLDVPKERFISFPGASPDADSSLMLGWAGWDHRQSAQALTVLIHSRSEEGWSRERITPLLAGLAEQLPWVRQWHSEVDPELGVSPAEMYSDFLADQQERFELSDADLANWRPAATSRRKKQK